MQLKEQERKERIARDKVDDDADKKRRFLHITPPLNETAAVSFPRSMLFLLKKMKKKLKTNDDSVAWKQIYKEHDAKSKDTATSITPYCLDADTLLESLDILKDECIDACMSALFFAKILQYLLLKETQQIAIRTMNRRITCDMSGKKLKTRFAH